VKNNFRCHLSAVDLLGVNCLHSLLAEDRQSRIDIIMRGFSSSSFSRLFHLGVKLAGGAVGVVSSGFIVSNCATSLGGKGDGEVGGGGSRFVSSAGGGGPPDFIPTRPWNFNWDWYGRHFDNISTL